MKNPSIRKKVEKVDFYFFCFVLFVRSCSCDSFTILLMQLKITKLNHSLNQCLLRNQLLLYHSPQKHSTVNINALLFQMIKTFETSPGENKSRPHCQSIPAALTPSWHVDVWMHIWLQGNSPLSSSRQEGGQHTAAPVAVTCGHWVTQQIFTETNMSNRSKQTIWSKEVIFSSICLYQISSFSIFHYNSIIYICSQISELCPHKNISGERKLTSHILPKKGSSSKRVRLKGNLCIEKNRAKINRQVSHVISLEWL